MALDDIGGKLVGFPRGGAVADRDQLHVVLRTQRAQRADRPLPIVPRLVRVDGGGVEQLAGAVDDCHLHAGPNPGIEADRDPLPRRCRQQEIVQVPAEDGNGFSLRLLPQPLFDLELEVHRQLELPGPPDGFDQPRVGGAPLVLHPDSRGDASLRL